MIDPPRLREGEADAPPELTELFRGAKKPEPLTPAVDARVLAKISGLAPVPAAPPFKGWLIASGAVAVAGAVALVTQRAPAPSAVRTPPPAHSTTSSARASAWGPAPPAVEPAPLAPEPPRSPESKRVPAAGESSPRSPSSAEDALGGEAKLLNEAHAAMATDPRKAYVLASEHTKRYPRGQLAAERELILIQALIKLGRTAEAEARGRALRKSTPSSIYGERLDAILKGK